MAAGAAIFCKRRGGLFRPVFLDEAQDDAGQQDRQNDPGVQVLSQEEGNPGGHDAG